MAEISSSTAAMPPVFMLRSGNPACIFWAEAEAWELTDTGWSPAVIGELLADDDAALVSAEKFRDILSDSAGVKPAVLKAFTQDGTKPSSTGL